jgi:hypothetical protein
MMAKLFELKTWVTIADAAKRLSCVLGEDVTPEDVLQLAFKGRFDLSVYFPTPVLVRKYAVLTEDETLDLLRAGKLPGMATQISDDLFIIGTDKTGYATGERELSRYGCGYSQAVFHVRSKFPCPLLIGNQQDGLYRLERDQFPEDAVIIVMSSELSGFESSINPPAPKKTEAPEERWERIAKRKSDLIAAGVRNFLQVISKEEGFSKSRIKQILEKAEAQEKKDNHPGIDKPITSFDIREATKKYR